MISEQVRRVLTALEMFGRSHDACETTHSKKLLNLEPETARLLSIMLQASQARFVLEIGTSNGYSTIWIAASIENRGGHLVSIDRSAEKHVLAGHNLSKAGLSEIVDLRTGDADEIVSALQGPWDAVFFDADRISAPRQLKILYPRLAQRALLFADNVLSHPEEIQGYLSALKLLPGFTHCIVPIGKGLSVAYRG